MNMLAKFAGTGVFVGGALIAGMKLYAERRDQVAKKEEVA
jgi:hypothetical protein